MDSRLTMPCRRQHRTVCIGSYKEREQNMKREKKLTFEQLVVRAALDDKEGTPLKDTLDDEDIREAICRLADVYVALNIVNVSEVS